MKPLFAAPGSPFRATGLSTLLALNASCTAGSQDPPATVTAAETADASSSEDGSSAGSSGAPDPETDSSTSGTPSSSSGTTSTSSSATTSSATTLTTTSATTNDMASEEAGSTSGEYTSLGSDSDASSGASAEETGDTFPFEPSFILGADVSSIQEAEDLGTVYRDTDGQMKPMLELLKNHGFNYVRLRVFVDPAAQYGYASSDSCNGRAEPYNDRDHTVEYAQEVKRAGMGLLIDFHYSDTWADPGKQVIPESWRGLTSIEELATAVHDHTTDVMTALEAAGALPDMVQVGNEITPGMLLHVPTGATDCYGNNSTPTSPNGSTSNWDQLAQLLHAGTQAVRDIDPEIKVMLHIENTDDLAGAQWWLENAISRGVDFDILGLSAYEAFQGPPATWRNTFQSLATEFPQLEFVLAEYNPHRREANDIMRELPDGRGLGTFFWEPTQSGSWGSSMFTAQGNVLVANASDFQVFDQIVIDYGL